MAKAKPKERRSIALNRKAHHAYHVLDELECGIQLLGTEVKSLRAGHCSLQEAYGRLKRKGLYLVGANIPVYSHGNIHNHVPTRERLLLAHKHELEKWNKAVTEKGTTIVPLEIYFQKSLVKVSMALCRGKKLFDKREDQKERDHQRDIDRAMSRRR